MVSIFNMNSEPNPGFLESLARKTIQDRSSVPEALALADVDREVIPRVLSELDMAVGLFNRYLVGEDIQKIGGEVDLPYSAKLKEVLREQKLAFSNL
ncbi:hypothetical protein A2961_00475 [Candidatus Woesebacteria bacterium RIFCSPLOWO2_01_FULL_39_21]|uniref:Uncharacterized protein n=1 Tax=Candidatus Woesebacteria bacterium RIFCSPLOWO2_01_FULL_39_21 TaxID=1802519 RepID=A0A1F8BBY1_9BACT|nr:MAG: hypothetical protein A2691_00395 [Candidatus Woesebacteria bacterium RIFCSPHIGHO2_01_FULL_39_23]OGM61179.1 MAG: hypothetical protein A2961_00475 [Candidatus Woesebacteria bacterium RIFCSPLOWO2_01_FULL_39_21]